MNTEIFEKLESIHNTINEFFRRLDAIESLTEKQKSEILKEANFIVAPCTAAHGEYTYLFKSVSNNFQDRYNDFWDRIEKKGDYAE